MKNPRFRRLRCGQHAAVVAWAAAVFAVLLLPACGGGSATDGADDLAAQQTLQARTASSGAAQWAPNAKLTEQSLAAAEQQAQEADAVDANNAGVEKPSPLSDLTAGEIAPKSAYVSGEVVRKAAAVRIPAYRFLNGSTGAHFFTTSTAERDNVVAKLSPPFSLEGEAFSVASAFSPGLSPVHRFYNTQTGVHFYTISESERVNVDANFPQFRYEGVAYHASQVAGAGLIPLYRFFVPSKGFHFYTANESEKDRIIATQALTFSFEGIGYYVLDSDWRGEKLQHTGISKCYQAGSYTLVSCSLPETADLNPQQDGHRKSINVMGYSAVGGRALTTCVRDKITGLIWEGKEASGTRSGSKTYTHLGGGASTDTSGYVAEVNASNLCGFSDWRLPTRHELSGVMDLGRTLAPLLNNTSFPNTASAEYWTADGVSTDSPQAWTLNFSDGLASRPLRSTAKAVRLVRGSQSVGTRYTFSTVVYGSDAANNVANDAWTGLQWRRCEEGRVWSGSTCTGTAIGLTHELALGYARSVGGWRLPNVKELSSLVKLNVSSGPLIDLAAFPSATGDSFWTSSPNVRNDYVAWYVYFTNGAFEFNNGNRAYEYKMRLVRVSQ